jgi:hypothetical protein
VLLKLLQTIASQRIHKNTMCHCLLETVPNLLMVCCCKACKALTRTFAHSKFYSAFVLAWVTYVHDQQSLHHAHACSSRLCVVCFSCAPKIKLLQQLAVTTEFEQERMQCCNRAEAA